MARFEVYKHTAPGGRSYVGWTSQGSARRWGKHASDSRKGSDTAFHRAIRKYGPDAFTHEILERMTTEAGAKRAEQLWIARFGTFGVGGYNTTPGGDGRMGGGRVFSAVHRQRLSEAHRGKTAAPETRAKMAERRRGRRHTDEARAKMSAALFAAWARRRAGV